MNGAIILKNQHETCLNKRDCVCVSCGIIVSGHGVAMMPFMCAHPWTVQTCHFCIHCNANNASKSEPWLASSKKRVNLHCPCCEQMMRSFQGNTNNDAMTQKLIMRVASTMISNCINSCLPVIVACGLSNDLLNEHVACCNRNNIQLSIAMQVRPHSMIFSLVKQMFTFKNCKQTS